MKHLYRFMARLTKLLLVTFLACFSSSLLLAQGFASPSSSDNTLVYNKMSDKDKTEILISQKLKNVRLTSLLSELESTFNVNFAYDSDMLEGQEVEVLDVETNSDLEELLHSLLNPLNMKFKKFGNSSYAIYKNEPAKEAMDGIKTLKEKDAAVPSNIQKLQMKDAGTALADTRENPSFRVTGRVVTDDNETLPGVSVSVKGTSTGTITDVNGNYSVNVPDVKSILVFSFIGYKVQEVPVSGRSVINVTLVTDIKALEEVVVIGYGSQRKADLTSSVASVKSDDFVKGAVNDVGQLLQGKVAGLAIGTASGDPAANSQIVLRGTSTITGSSEPLILIDGIPGNLNTVAPEDIESIDVLKDGSAAAIYGTRGSNGVILVTTRRANGNVQPSIEYSGYTSTQTIAKRPEMLNADDYRRLIAQGVGFDDRGHSTDWQDAIMQTPFIHVHNVTLRGGNAKTNYLATGTYRSFDGIIQRSSNRTFTSRADVNHNMFDNKLKLNFGFLNTNNTYTTTNNVLAASPNSMGRRSSFNGAIYRQAIIRNPTAPITDGNGNWDEQPGAFNYENPLARLYESDGQNNWTNSRVNGSVAWEPVDNLVFKALVSYDKNHLNRGYSETKQHISHVRDGRNGYASRGASTSIDRLVELTADYNKSMGDHRFTVLGGYGYQDNTWEDYYMQNWDFPTDKFTYNNMGAGRQMSVGHGQLMQSDKRAWNLVGFFGRATYSFKDKYLLMGSLRYEGSSKFVGANKPWGTFPAVSAGWRLNKEGFMHNLSFIDDLKIRGGYGVTGAMPDDLFLGVARLSYSGFFLVNGQWTPMLVPASNPNPYLRWEEKHETNAGFDFSLFKGKVSGSFDYYVRRTDGLLYDYPVPTPPNLFGSTRANVGVMENRGVEILVNFVPLQTKSFVWNSSVNFSTNSNKLISLSNEMYSLTNDFINVGNTGEPISTYTHRIQVGEAIGNFYGFKVVDIGDDGRWIYENRTGERVHYNDFAHSDDDKMRLGNGLPNYYAGWNNSFRYKNFTLDVMMRGAFDFQILNFQRMYYTNPGVVQYNQLKTAHDPVFGKVPLDNNVPLEYNSYFIENGDFWKIDNITLGYNIKSPVLKYFQNVRVYTSLLNALIITGYQGIDPEVNRLGLTPGNDHRDQYPNTRTYTVGMNFTLK